MSYIVFFPSRNKTNQVMWFAEAYGLVPKTLILDNLMNEPIKIDLKMQDQPGTTIFFLSII